MPPSPSPEDAPEDSFLRDPSALDGFLEDVRSDPAEDGAPDPDEGPDPSGDPAPVETPREVSVEVEQARLDAEAVAADAPAADTPAADAAAAGAQPAEAEPAAGAAPDTDRFWGDGFQPAIGVAADEVEAAEEADGGGGLAAKLAKLGKLMPGGGD